MGLGGGGREGGREGGRNEKENESSCLIAEGLGAPVEVVIDWVRTSRWFPGDQTHPHTHTPTHPSERKERKKGRRKQEETPSRRWATPSIGRAINYVINNRVKFETL